MATKITPRKAKEKDTVVVRTTDSGKNKAEQGEKWWLAHSQTELCNRVLDTVTFLKDSQMYRYRQAGVFARLYGNMPLINVVGSSLNKSNPVNALPIDRPTMNVVQSCVDTLVSRISQGKPTPRFLTDNGDTRERTLAKQMNSFINGELYRTKAHDLGKLILRDACVIGDGVVKIYRTADDKVGLDRVLNTELLVDPNDGVYGNPRQLFHMKLADRAVVQAYFDAKHRAQISRAEQAFPDSGQDAQKTISDQIMVVEGWRLPSKKDAGDGRHVIVCSAGVLLDEEYKRETYPFTMLPYSPRMTGFWAQGLAEQLMGTQVEINKLLMTISKSINLVGVPRVFVEDGSKVVKAHLNNDIGSIVTYRGTKPSYEVAPCVPQELYAQLERLVQYAYQQSGISGLAAVAQKPAGLNSGAALRSYDDIQSDRFAVLEKRYADWFVDLSYQIITCATDIANDTKSYSTVFPNKDGTKEIDLPKSEMLKDVYVIQCFDTSSLPRDPAGRLENVVERMQAGLLSPQEGRRLLGYPDLEQVDKLEEAAQERIYKVLDEIVEDGKYTSPDPFMDLQAAKKICTQYYNLYIEAKLSDEKAQKLRDFSLQVDDLLMQASQPPPMAPGAPKPGAAAPIANPQAPPVSDLLPV